MADSELSVLIVDSDSNFRSSLSLELKNQGFRVATSSSSNRAFEQFPRMEFDVIIADLTMPEGTGPDLIQKLRERKFTVPVILTSANANSENTPFQQLGAASFLKKPFSPQIAVERIQLLRTSLAEFSYFLNVRRTLTVVSWVGVLSARHSSLLTKCSQDIAATTSKYVIFNLHGFTGYDTVLAGDIVKFQEQIRNKPASLVICGLNSAMREKMSSKGLLHESELIANLQAALQYLLEIGLKS